MKPLFIYLLLLTYYSSLSQSIEVRAVGITVNDIEKEKTFFKEILDFTCVRDTVYEDTETKNVYNCAQCSQIRIVTLKLGAEQIKLLKFTGENGRPYPPDSKSNDLWFQHIAIVVQDMDSAYHTLWNHHVHHISTSPQTLPSYLPAAAGIKAFYFTDPENHPLELIYFPENKGADKWHRSQGLFKGIDHTAIGISNTDLAKKLYTDVLGLVVAGHSENYGTEQEHLNQVFGARLDITGLKAPSGMGVEFLNYITPRGGRLFPTESQPWDLWHYQTEITVDQLEPVVQKLQNQNYKIISKIRNEDGKIGKQLLVRDQDGHALLLIQKN